MANQLADPGLWQIGPTSPPPSYWNGSAYVVNNSEAVYEPFFMYYNGPRLDGDVISGSILFDNQAHEPAYLVAYSYDADSVIGSTPLVAGVETEFSFPAGLDYDLLIATTDNSDSPASFYGLKVTIDPNGSVGPGPGPSEVNYNCECDDDYPRKTLAELRSDVFDALGFIDPLSGAPSKTLSAMRADVIEQLGLADALTGLATKTFGAMRLVVYRAMGYASQIAGIEAGTVALVGDFLNKAQQLAWRRLELDKGGQAAPAAMVADSDPSSLDHVLIEEIAISLAKAHQGNADAKAHSDLAERYLADTAARRPPGLTHLIDGALKHARAAVARRYEMGLPSAYALPAFVADGDQSVIDYYPVQTLAIATIKAKVGHTDAKALMEEYEQYMRGMALRQPPNAPSVVTRNIVMAQEQAYRMYEVFRTERMFTWDMEAGVRFYDLAENADTCTKKLDPRKVSWVGISQANGSWLPLRCGIPPELYGFDRQANPTRYEIRQCIEVWPAPSDETWRLRIKGHFGLMPFAADSDVTTIDWQAVYLLAVANCKSFYKQPDASAAGQQFQRYLYDLTAGSHHTRRYIHGARVGANQPRPVWEPGEWPP